MGLSYTVHHKVVLRTPYYPLQKVYTNLSTWLADEIFQEAIYYASPLLHEQTKQISEFINFPASHSSLALSLNRYATRMSSRPTPFGLFACNTILDWSDDARIRLAEPRKSTRFNTNFLSKLADELSKDPSLRTHLHFYANTSRYRIYDQIRFVDAQIKTATRLYSVTSVAYHEILEKILDFCQKGCLMEEIIRFMVKAYEVSADESRPYIEQLIDSQLLVHELKPSVVETNYLERIYTHLENIYSLTAHDGLKSNLDTFKEFMQILVQINNGKCSLIQAEHLFKQKLKEGSFPLTTLNLSPHEKIFHTDTIRQIATGGLHHFYQRHIEQAIQVLSKITKADQQDRLNQFVQRYQQRYGHKPMPLLEVLDSETGIGYSQDGPLPVSSWTSLSFPQQYDFKIEVATPQEHWLWNLLQEAIYQNRYEVVLTEKQIQDLPENTIRLPPTLSASFRVTNYKKPQVFVENIGGSSAINYWSRLAYADTKVFELAQDLARKEQSGNPEVVFAEINHVPDDQMIDVLTHPPLFYYEIPYLSPPGREAAYQILPCDLYIHMEQDQVVLTSRRLNKRVIPRLCHAYNYTLSALPVFKFLCDLQTAGLQSSLSFCWGTFGQHFKFLPRVSYKNTILHLATWQLTQSDLQVIASPNRSPDISQFHKFVAQWKLPRYFTLADSDRELLVDTSCQQMIETWWETVKYRNTVILKEWLYDTDNIVQDQQGQRYAHQFIANFVAKEPVYQPSSCLWQQDQEVQRNFLPGSDWLFIKVYCGCRVADCLLTDMIKPLTESLLSEKIIDAWFFIRYDDPRHHLRLRFHLTDAKRWQQIAEQLNDTLAPLLASEVVWDVSIDTYRRETERYDPQAVAEAEALFFYDSQAVLQFLTEAKIQNEIRWLWAAYSANQLLEDFHFTLMEKLSLIDNLKNAFHKEFEVDKTVKSQLAQHYRKYKDEIARFLDKSQDKPEYKPLLDIIHRRSVQQQSTVQRLITLAYEQKLSVPFTSLLESYIHMLMNRIFASDQRLNEMILYDMLSQHYRSNYFKSKKTNPLIL